MLKPIALGVLSALFFSTTFLFNRALSLQGGHWYWTASLRYLFMYLLLTLWITGKYGVAKYLDIYKIFRRNWKFWILAGTIGFGLFYSGICIGAFYLPGWVVATTWQCTILFTPIVLYFFGRKTSGSTVATALVIFFGVILVNAEQVSALNISGRALGLLPIALAALCYPIGNQMVWEAINGNSNLFPKIPKKEMEDPLIRLFLMTLGSLPFWIALYFYYQPGAPSRDQILSTFLVALFSGIVATGLFYHARHLCRHALEISAVDSTQAMEVVFTLVGEKLLLNGIFPGFTGWLGIAIILGGQVLFLILNRRSQVKETMNV